MTDKKETEKLVLDYLNAAANLYYYIPIQKLLEIYNLQNEPLTADEFCGIIEQILEEHHFFDLFSEEEIDTEEPDDKPTYEKIFLAEHLYCVGDFDDYFELKEATFGIPYHILDKKSFLKYADDLYVEKTPEFISLRAYYRNIPGLSLQMADEFALEAVDMLRISNGDIKFAFSQIEELDVFPKNQSAADKFIELLFDLRCNVRLASLRGATIKEMQM